MQNWVVVSIEHVKYPVYVSSSGDDVFVGELLLLLRGGNVAGLGLGASIGGLRGSTTWEKHLLSLKRS